MLTPKAREWIAAQKKITDGMSNEKMYTEWFFRDPPRPETSDRDFLFSPADGFITTQGRFDPDADLLDVKGASCTTNDLLGMCCIEQPAFVSCVFMSALDVHVNRTPSECILVRHALPPLRTMGVPMLWEEKALLDDLRISKPDMAFMRDNERVVNCLYAPHLKYRYYVVQIADSDVNYIVPMRPIPTTWYNQNERFGQIRWGSMCCLILPLDPRLKFKALRPIGDHVECCNDPLVSVERR